MNRSDNRRPTGRIDSDRPTHPRRGDGLRKEQVEDHKHDDESNASADLLARHWLLVRQLTTLCGGIEHAGADVDSTLTSGLKTLARIVPRATSLAFHRKGDLFIEMSRDARRKRWQIELAEFLTFRSRLRAVEGAPTEMVRTVSADNFACFQGFKLGHRDGLIALLGQANDPKALLFLWPKNTLLQEDEDVFTVVAVCMGTAFAVAEKRDAESRRALAQKDADAAKMEVGAWRDMATKIAHLTSTPLALARQRVQSLLVAGDSDVRKQLVDVERYLGEAAAATDRAFLFDYASETFRTRPVPLNRTLDEAGQAAKVGVRSSISEGSCVRANPFRLKFALRDLLYSARLLDPSCTCEARPCNGSAVIEVTMPTPIQSGFRPKDLFSCGHHILLAEQQATDAALFPPRIIGISLMLAKRLIEEIPVNGNLQTVKVNGGKHGMRFDIHLPLVKGR